MSNELTITERLEATLDKIFLLNHNIVSEMIQGVQDPEYARYPLLMQQLEDRGFETLGEYYRDLRSILRECLSVSDELLEADLEGLSTKAKHEVVIQGREEYKDKLIETMESRFKGLYASMNFVPMSAHLGEDEIELTSIYDGKPEEFVRAQEYRSLIESVMQQIEILYFEDALIRNLGEDSVVSPYVVPTLIDTIARVEGFKKAERQCQKYLEGAKKQEELFEAFPELRETKEQVELLNIQNRYRRRFEEAVGALNPHTNYSKWFLKQYKMGLLPIQSGFSHQEIRQRIDDSVEEYTSKNKDVIKDMFDSSIKKYSKFRKRKNFETALAKSKVKISELSSKPKKWLKKAGILKDKKASESESKGKKKDQKDKGKGKKQKTQNPKDDNVR